MENKENNYFYNGKAGNKEVSIGDYTYNIRSSSSYDNPYNETLIDSSSSVYHTKTYSEILEESDNKIICKYCGSDKLTNKVCSGIDYQDNIKRVTCKVCFCISEYE